MADNYLERKMEDYRAGRTGSFHTTRPAKAITAGIFIAGSDTDAVERLAVVFAGKGWKVAIAHPDMKRGSRLAQKHGLQHHPIDCGTAGKMPEAIGEIMRRWNRLDLIMICGEADLSGLAELGIPVVRECL